MNYWQINKNLEKQMVLSRPPSSFPVMVERKLTLMQPQPSVRAQAYSVCHVQLYLMYVLPISSGYRKKPPVYISIFILCQILSIVKDANIKPPYNCIHV